MGRAPKRLRGPDRAPGEPSYASKVSNLVRRAPAGKFLSPAAAIQYIQRQKVQRVYRETPALDLLGMEDEISHRVPWLREHGKPVQKTDESTLDQVRDELAKRTSAEMEPVRVEWIKRNKILSYFPDEGPLRRELYVRHMECIGHTLTSDEVLFMAGNRVGKSLLGAYCIAVWTTGRYPHWWHGRVFDRAVTMWIANKSAKDVRDINEQELLGPPGDDSARGTAMLPSHLINKVTPKPGVPNGSEFIQVRHISGDISHLVSKSYDQGRTAFQGRGVDGVWGDEEIDLDTYGELVPRVMTTEGILLTTFTPIQGLTPMTAWFIEAAGITLDQIRNATAKLVQ